MLLHNSYVIWWVFKDLLLLHHPITLDVTVAGFLSMLSILDICLEVSVANFLLHSIKFQWSFEFEL
jgi:hypothetical protein